MISKAVGAFFVVIGCGSLGFLTAQKERKTVKELAAFQDGLIRIKIELQYRLLPLPCIFRTSGKYSDGIVGQAFLIFADEMDSQRHTDLMSCMVSTLERLPQIGAEVRELFLYLGNNIGNLDLENQLNGITQVEKLCEKERKQKEEMIAQRKRYYETLGLCAGAALAIILV